MFSIKFISEPYTEKSESCGIDEPFTAAKAQIQVGDFNEIFIVGLEEWKQEVFRNQWNEGLRRIIENDFCQSILLTEIQDPSTGWGILGWVLYRENDIVYVQEHGYLFEEMPEPFDENNPYKYIRERETEGEEGEKISEWSCSIEDVERFLKDEKAG